MDNERSLAKEITEGFEALQSMRNNEPVAWMFQGAFDISTYVSVEKPNPDIYPNPTPLYTHPVKELILTDDEVEEFEWVLKKHFNFPTSEKVPNLDRIIRAILRKAQENG
jgi:hypothetical protein